MPVSLPSWTRALAVLAVLAAAPAGAAPRTYVVDPAASSVRIHVGKSGAFSFAGHKHEVVAPAVSGEVTADPADLGASRVDADLRGGCAHGTARGRARRRCPEGRRR